MFFKVSPNLFYRHTLPVRLQNYTHYYRTHIPNYIVNKSRSLLLFTLTSSFYPLTTSSLLCLTEEDSPFHYHQKAQPTFIPSIWPLKTNLFLLWNLFCSPSTSEPISIRSIFQCLLCPPHPPNKLLSLLSLYEPSSKYKD